MKMRYAYLYVMKILRYATAVEEAAPPAFESVRGRERRGEKGEEGVGGFSQPTNFFLPSRKRCYTTPILLTVEDFVLTIA